MVSGTAVPPASSEGARVVDLRYPGTRPDLPFTRADLVYTGIDHARSSFEVRVFLNNPTAGVTTSRTPAERYAGRFHIFGHGGCFGDVGHCDVHRLSLDPTDLRPAHPLTPLATYLTITTALREVLAGGGHLETVTLVTIAVTPRRADRIPAPDLFQFDEMELHTYLSEDDAPRRDP